MRKLIWIVALVAAAIVADGGVAVADGHGAAKLRATKMVRVKVGNNLRKGVGLRGEGDGWHLELPVSHPTEAVDVAEIFDVTPGAPARTWTLAVRNDELRFDLQRFVGGHSYRVQLFSGDERRDTLWVLLFPSPRIEQTKELVRAPKEPPQQLRFVDHEPAASDDAIKPVAKSF